MTISQPKPPVVTARRIMKIIAIFCIIVCFCPTFLVSCSGRDIDVTVMDASFGMSYRGESVTDPYPFMILCLLIPVAALIVLYLKKIKDKMSSLAISIAMGLDIILWIVFYFGVRAIAEENYCDFKATGWYLLNMLAMIGMTVLGVMVYLRKFYYDGNLLEPETAQKAREKITQVSKTVSTSVSKMTADVSKTVIEVAPEDIIGYCNKCGTPLSKDSRFCVKCGTPVPEVLMPKPTTDSTVFQEPETAHPVLPAAPANTVQAVETSKDDDTAVNTNTGAETPEKQPELMVEAPVKTPAPRKNKTVKKPIDTDKLASLIDTELERPTESGSGEDA